MSTGLIALLDDIAGLAKVAAATLDDVGAQAARAGVKAAGVVIDDTAVTPLYVAGFSAAREVPIVARIALGSLRNKLLFLLPGALTLSLLAPWAITPLLMLGAIYLCYEGAEKIWHAAASDKGDRHEAATLPPPQDPQVLEDAKVRSAIGTDFILSAEIMTITLGTLPALPLWEQAVVLAIVGVGITAGVYGIVALIVKADDAGLAMAGGDRPISAVFRRRIGVPLAADRAIKPVTQAVGRGLVIGMPRVLSTLSVVGTAAMVWVGGGIIVHGLGRYGLPQIGQAIHDAAVAAAVPAVPDAAEWMVMATGSGLVGLAVGAVLIVTRRFVMAPTLKAIHSRRKIHRKT